MKTPYSRRAKYAPGQEQNPSGFCMCGCGNLAPPATRTRRGANVKGQPLRFIRGHNPVKEPGPLYIENEITGCWEWQRNRDALGYGRYLKNGEYLAHRAFYCIHYGAIPDGFDIDHLCKNPTCVNPRHLEAISHKQNVQRGNLTKLRPDDVHTIRKLLLDKVPNRQIASRFNISVSNLHRIRRRETWTNI